MNIFHSILSAVIGGVIVALGWVHVLGRKFQIIDDLKTGLSEIKQDIKILIDRISKLEGAITGIVRKASPLSSTEVGAWYIKESGLEKILEERKDWLLQNIRHSLPQNYTDYDVQETARRVLLSLKDDLMMRPVKEFAFQNALEVGTILGAGALWLRDDFLGAPRKVAQTN